MGARLLLILPLGLFALGAGALPGCLDDLPEPTTCPAPPERADCLQVPMPMHLGCLSPDELACFTSSCACEADSCEPSDADCYPNGDCPEAVLREHPDAVCKRLRRGDYGDFGLADPAGFCSCGCVDCLGVCDGKGPVVGVVNDGGCYGLNDFPLPLAAIESRMPDSGSAGVYMRLRGYALPLYVVLFRKDAGAPGEISAGASYPIILLPSDGYVEQVGYRNLANGDPYSWKDAATKPNYIGILPNADADGDPMTCDASMPQLLTVEIDCIVPFYIPGD